MCRYFFQHPVFSFHFDFLFDLLRPVSFISFFSLLLCFYVSLVYTSGYETISGFRDFYVSASLIGVI